MEEADGGGLWGRWLRGFSVTFIHLLSSLHFISELNCNKFVFLSLLLNLICVISLSYTLNAIVLYTLSLNLIATVQFFFSFA